jgi:outer membrane protein OmpA-like peptidoglycan-associated protein
MLIDFLEKYPQSSHRRAAEAELAQVRAKAKAAPTSAGAPEDEARWQTYVEYRNDPRFGNTRERFETQATMLIDFLEKYPQSSHRRAAEAELAQMRAKAKAAPASVTPDEIAWGLYLKARDTGQFPNAAAEKQALEFFVANHRESLRVGEANARLRALYAVALLGAPPTDQGRIAAERRFIDSLRGRPARALTVKEKTEIANISTHKPNIDIEINFDHGSAVIDLKAVRPLVRLGLVLLEQNLKGTIFFVNGHTDAKGTAEYNQELSERRAESVKEFLVREFSLPADTLITVGFGKTRLKNRSDAFADENRRVQIVNTQQRSSAPAREEATR